MKRMLLTLLTIITCNASGGAGSINFVSWPYSIYINACGSRSLMPTSMPCKFALFMGPLGSSRDALRLVAYADSSSSSAGVFYAGTVVLPPPFIGGMPYAFQIRGWEAALGADWNSVSLAINYGNPGTYGSRFYGESAIGTIVPANASAFPPGPPPNVFLDGGIATFDLNMLGCVPPVTCPMLGGAPVAGAQPQSQTVLAGSSVSTYFGVGSLVAPYYLQWLKHDSLLNGIPVTYVDGATSTVLSFGSIQPSQAGTYSMIAANPGGYVRSSAATLTVLPLQILGQPAHQTATESLSATFNVAAQAYAALGYQWRKNGTNLPADPRFSGATASELTIANLVPGDAGSYSVLVTNTYGSVLSATALLTVLPRPVFTTNSFEVQAGQFSFAFSGQLGKVFEIWASTNLVNWSWLATVTNSGGVVPFTDTVTNVPGKFYEVRQLP